VKASTRRAVRAAPLLRQAPAKIFKHCCAAMSCRISQTFSRFWKSDMFTLSTFEFVKLSGIQCCNFTRRGFPRSLCRGTIPCGSFKILISPVIPVVVLENLLSGKGESSCEIRHEIGKPRKPWVKMVDSIIRLTQCKLSNQYSVKILYKVSLVDQSKFALRLRKVIKVCVQKRSI